MRDSGGGGLSGGLTEVGGLRVDGPLSPVGRTTTGPAELVMQPGPVRIDAAGGLDPSDRSVQIRRIDRVVFVRFQGLADAALDTAAGTATIQVCPTEPSGMDEVLAAGPVLALALALSGRPCLHASAVSIAGQAVAFAGPSGAGKSTLAALACIAGAELVDDDSLALALDGSHVRCLPGSREMRLRAPTAKLLAAADWPRRTTADARVAVLAGRKELAAPRLAAIVLPVITRDGTTGIERLRGAAASRAVLACAKVVSRTPEQQRAMFLLAATMAAGVAVYRVMMPPLTSAVLPKPIFTVLQAHFGDSL